MSIKRSSLVALCVLLAIVQGCRHQGESSSDLTLEHEVFPQPPHVGQVTIKLRLTDASGRPVVGAHITMEGNMSHPGMIPVFAEAKEVEPGRYQSLMQLSMAGDWYVLVHAALPNARRLEYQFEIKGLTPA